MKADILAELRWQRLTYINALRDKMLREVFSTCQPTAYSVKNRGVTMPPYGQEACANMAQQCATEEVYVNGKYLNRLDVAAAQQKFAERDAAHERRRLEEQKKKEEEAKRQANVRLCAERHLTRRHTWLLLDPARVREALTYADKYGNMVSLDEDGTMGHDPADIRHDDRPAGSCAFLPKARR